MFYHTDPKWSAEYIKCLKVTCRCYQEESEISLLIEQVIGPNLNKDKLKQTKTRNNNKCAFAQQWDKKANKKKLQRFSRIQIST